jgi:hypothetical protein
MLVHLISLLGHVRRSFTSSMGNITLGFFLPTLVVPTVQFIVAFAIIVAREGKGPQLIT